MKIVNIYNQTFIGYDPNAFEWNFNIAPFILKQKQTNKWKITVCNGSVYSENLNAKVIQLWTNDLATNASRMTDNDPNIYDTGFLLGSFGNYVSGINLQLSNNSAPMVYLINDLAKSPFRVYYSYADSNYNPVTAPLQISFTLRMEEIEM